MYKMCNTYISFMTITRYSLKSQHNYNMQYCVDNNIVLYAHIHICECSVTYYYYHHTITYIHILNTIHTVMYSCIFVIANIICPRALFASTILFTLAAAAAHMRICSSNTPIFAAPPTLPSPPYPTGSFLQSFYSYFILNHSRTTNNLTNSRFTHQVLYIQCGSFCNIQAYVDRNKFV